MTYLYPVVYPPTHTHSLHLVSHRATWWYNFQRNFLNMKQQTQKTNCCEFPFFVMTFALSFHKTILRFGTDISEVITKEENCRQGVNIVTWIIVKKNLTNIFLCKTIKRIVRLCSSKSKKQNRKHETKGKENSKGRKIMNID